jgi:hypothetical protein
MLNSGLLVLGGLNLLARQRSPRWGGTPMVPLLLSTVGVGALVVSAWIGGDLVYRLGWRVAPAEYDEQLESALHDRGDDALIAHAHHTVEQYEQTHALLP